MLLEQALKKIENAINDRHLCNIVGNCHVEYWGRAASKLSRGKRLLMIKGDSSFAIHQNRLLRPTNYMMNAAISCAIEENTLVITAKKTKPRETIKTVFFDIDDVQCYEMQENTDISLFGS
ncbi:MAG TPA: hypothetical protein VI977_06050, partial [archaeon]|nr:hypothetical protein [archaeon]